MIAADKVRAAQILEDTCRLYGVGLGLLTSKLKSPYLVGARKHAMARLRKECCMSYTDIGIVIHRTGPAVSRFSTEIG